MSLMKKMSKIDAVVMPIIIEITMMTLPKVVITVISP